MNNILDLRGKENQPNDSESQPAADDLNNDPSFFAKAKNYIWEVVKIVVISLIIIVPVRLYVIQPFIVEGDSMVPNFHDGEYLIVDEISYRFHQPKRGEVIVFHPPQDPKNYYIKRIIGLPGETVELREGKIYIYNEEYPQGVRLNESNYLTKSSISEISKVELGTSEYYVVGDNRDNSLDSRRIGPITVESIRGRALIRAFPFKNIGILETPDYYFNS